MAHTNNLKRKARTHIPAVSQKRKKQSTRANAHSDYPVVEEEEIVEPVEETPENRAALALVITEYHMLEKRHAASKDMLEKRLIKARQEEIGGLKAYQASSLHGGDKVRGGETGKWCVEALMEIQVSREK